MRYRVLALLPLWFWALAVSAEERVFRDAQAIRDGGLYGQVVHADFADEARPYNVLDMLRLMPRLKTLVIGGPRFDGNCLARLAKLKTLRVLVLDSVDLSDETLSEFQKSFPDLVVIRSQRLAIASIARLGREMTIVTRLSEQHSDVRELLGERYFREATDVDFSKLPNDESGPERILNEELAPLRMLPTLVRLDLTWTRIHDGGMYYLKPLTNLELLRIPLNDVTADGLVHLRGMQKLKFFGTPSHSSRIDDAGARHLASLQALETVWLDDTSTITDAGLEALGQLRHLRVLHLRSPQVHGSNLGQIAKLPELRELILGRAVRDVSALSKCPSLHTLSLTGAGINDEALSVLSRCKSLESLTLDKTAVTDKGVAQLSDLTRLNMVFLNDTQVGDAGVAALQKLAQLRELSLDRSKVTNAGLAEFRRFPLLESLSIHEMRLNKEGIQNLTQLKHLKSLAVSYARESFPDTTQHIAAHRALVDRLREALPGCEID